MRIMALIRQRDWNRPTKEIAMDLVYVTNLYRVPLDKIVFGYPVECDQRPEITDDPNTFVPVDIDANYDDRFLGLNGFMYRRLPISIIGSSTGPVIHPPQYPCTTYEILDQINEQLGLQLTKDDVVDITYAENQPGGYKLYIHKHSLAWLGEYDIVLGEAGPGQNLVQVTNLNGFNMFNP